MSQYSDNNATLQTIASVKAQSVLVLFITLL